MTSTLKRLDEALYRVERWMAAALFLVMSGIMFAYVAHRVFSREDSRVAVAVMRIV